MADQSFRRRIFFIEIIFFIGYFVLFPVLADIEFNLREPGGTLKLVLSTLPFRTMSGVLHLVPYFIYYRYILHPYLKNKKAGRFIAGVLILLATINFYTPLANMITSAIQFSRVPLRSAEGIDFREIVVVNFSVMYILRELLIVSALGYIIRTMTQDKELQEIRTLQLNSELNFLKLQLHPHFFFNTLNNIYSLSIQQSELAPPLIARHAEIMRYILYKSPEQLVTLTEEAGFLKNYVEVEAIRYGDRVDIRFEYQGLGDRVKVEPLLLLPFIENTFKHGASEIIDQSFIHILISLADTELTVEIRNSKITGTGNNDNQDGIGLQNAAKRLDLLYPGNYSLEINDTNDVFEVRLSILLKPW